jgi:hypothetical protein
MFCTLGGDNAGFDKLYGIETRSFLDEEPELDTVSHNTRHQYCCIATSTLVRTLYCLEPKQEGATKYLLVLSKSYLAARRASS